MRSKNKVALLGFVALAGCVGGGDYNGPRLPDPAYADSGQGGAPQGYPQGYPQGGPPVADNNGRPPTGPAPLGPGEMDAAPPLSEGPSGTSGSDTARYDEVGYASWYGDEMAGGRTASGAPFNPQGFTAAHRTLPLGSYVEVTSLDSGRTILVQINDRGPRAANNLIDLSQGAAQALGIQGRGAVRVRRVVPSPGDLAAFRAGQPGAPRLDTPPVLLAGLRQRMGGGAPPSPMPPRRPVTRPTPVPQTVVPPRGAPAPGRPAPVKPATGSYYVQVAAFASQPRAAALAKSLGGSAVSAGSVWRVRLGPYTTPDQAARARDAAAARGYGDARVVRED